MRARVKVCCIASEDEARRAVDHGASALGLVSAMPSGPGPIPEERIARIAATVPPGVSTFLLTSLTETGPLVAQHRVCGTSVIQLVARTGPRVREELREALPGVRLVQVVHVEGPEALEEARDAAVHADAILLDSGRPGAAVPELGGTGRIHDWAVSRRIREALSTPVFLAGGLTPTNVAEAIRAVEPWGVDLCSGLRRDGELAEDLLATFMKAVRGA